MSAYNVGLTDYIPSGLTLNDGDWVLAGTNATYTLAGPLAAGSSATVDITFTIDASFAGTSLTNVGEISSADNDTDGTNTPPTDVDSTPDGTNNDTVGGDNVTDNSNSDEDDHDPATIPVTQPTPVFDLALVKTLKTGQTSSVNLGDNVDFTITVYNQGNVDAHNVQVMDYIPTGLTLNDADWSLAGTNATYNTLVDIPAGQNASFDITFTVSNSFTGTSIVNFAEIAVADNDEDNTNTAPTDVDSTPDTNSTNDGTPVDNATDNSGGDQDDHDPATINVIQPIRTFDLALVKLVSNSQNYPIAPGNDVTFTITVFNQGNVDATNVQITDYIPTGMTLNDSDWTGAGSTATYNTPIPTLASGTSFDIEITLTVSPTFTGTQLINYAEILSAGNQYNLTDVDSSPDNTNGNDTGGQVGTATDNMITDNGTLDEDDHDPALVVVTQPEPEFDLALVKRLAPNQGTSFSPNDLITYRLTLYNQGDLTAYRIYVNDYLPNGLILQDADWTNNNGTIVYNTPIPVLAPGQSVDIDITLRVSPVFTGTIIVNVAEISAADDDTDTTNTPPTDVDSTPDSNPNNEGTPVNDVTDNTGNDEDDSDIETVTINQPTPIHELAIIKDRISSSPVAPGSDVLYRLRVTNLGNQTETNIQVYDQLPSGLELNDPNWTVVSGNTIRYNTPIASLVPGFSADVFLQARISSNFTGSSLINTAYIQFNDNQTNNTDTAIVYVTPNVFDLALQKNSLVSGAVTPGSTITYTLTVTNQGTIPARRVHVTDYIPQGLTLADNNWLSSTGTAATNVIPIDRIEPGESVTLTITFVVNPNYCGGAICNRAEICFADDDMNATNTPPTDVDSHPDTNPNNDSASEDDIDDICTPVDCEGGGGTNNPPFDLALRKKLATGQESTVNAGDNVTFTIEVFNQGEVAAYNINVTDYIPTGLILNDAAWAQSGTRAVLNTPIPYLAVGTSTTRNITFTVSPTFTGTSITNIAEIRNADNDTNSANPLPTDADSYADTNPGNDIMTNDVINGANGDEDDHDPATITVNPAPPTPTFDLALRKMLAAGQATTVQPGDNVNYVITVVNQGQANAYNVNVADYIPTGMTLNDPDWSMSGSHAVLNNPISFIAAGAQASVNITLRVSASFTGGSITNFAEISTADNDNNPSNTPPTDIDSQPDTNPSNDGPFVDNELNNLNNDEDDHDPASINVNIVTPPTCPTVTINSTAFDASCGQANGSISLNLSGVPAGANVVYNWSNGANTANLNNLTAGTYSVTVTVQTSGLSCMYTKSVSISSLQGPTVSLNNVTGENCSTLGTISLQVASGQAPYTITWSGAASGTQTSNGGAVNLNNLTAGTYNFNVQSANNCSASISVVVPNNGGQGSLSLNTNGSNPTACGATNGQIVITATGGSPSYKFYLNGTLVQTSNSATYTATNLGAGTYTVNIVDANGCNSETETVSLIEGTPQPVLGWSASNGNCGEANGSISYNGNGSASIQYQLFRNGETTPIATVNGNQTYNNSLAAGTYLVRTVAANGCSSSLTLVITAGAPAIQFDVTHNNANCNSANSGSVAAINITGGVAPYTTTIHNANGQTVSGNALPAGTYTVIVSSAGGCSTTKTVTIQGGTAITAMAVITQHTCEGGNTLGAATVTATGGSGYTYQWSNGATTQNISNITPGTYLVTVTSANGCTASSSVLLQSGATTCVMPTVTTVNITHATCGAANGAATIVLPNPQAYEYVWSPGLGTPTNNIGNGRTNLPAGKYQVVITDPCLPNCYTKIIINITNSGTGIAAPTVNTTSALCGLNNGTATLSPASNYYNWGNGVTGATRSNLAAGTYIVTVSASASSACTTTASVVVANGGVGFTASASVNSQPTCDQANGSVTIQVSGGSGNFTYSWGSGATRTNLAAGSHTVTITDSQSGCTNTVSFTLVNVNQGCQPACDTSVDSIQVSVADCTLKADVCLPIPLAQYWQHTVTVNGTAYAGIVKGCNIINDVANGSMIELPVGTHSVSTTAPGAACPELYHVTVTCINGLDGNDNGGNTQNDPPVAEAQSSTERIKAADDYLSTSKSKSVEIYVLDNDRVANEQDVEITLVEQPTRGSVEYIGDGTFKYTPNDNFCDGNDQFKYQIENETGREQAKVVVNVKCASLTIFSGLSPNGDGINDLFIIKGIEDYPTNTVTIFNDKGAQVYFKRGYSNTDAWDARWNGRLIDNGTYYYIVNDGKGNSYSGYLQVRK